MRRRLTIASGDGKVKVEDKGTGGGAVPRNFRRDERKKRVKTPCEKGYSVIQ